MMGSHARGRRSRAIVALAALVSGTVLATAVEAATVLGNIPTTAGSGTTFGTGVQKGYCFTVPAGSPHQLTRVALRLGNYSTTTPANVTVELYNEATGPGGTLLASLGTITVAPGTSDTVLSAYPNGDQVLLGAGTNYCVVVSGDAHARWIGGNPQTQPAAAMGFAHLDYYFSTNSGGAWTTSVTYNQIAIDAFARPVAVSNWAGGGANTEPMKDSEYRAYGFTTPPRPYELRRVRFRIQGTNEDPNLPVTVELRGDNAGKPAGTALATLAKLYLPARMSTNYDVALVPTGKLLLAANTSYWIVWYQTGGMGTVYFRRQGANTPPTMALGFASIGYMQDLGNGAGWVANANNTMIAIDVADPSFLTSTAVSVYDTDYAYSPTTQVGFGFSPGQNYLLTHAAFRFDAPTPAQASSATVTLNADAAGSPGAIIATLGMISRAANGPVGDFLAAPAAPIRLTTGAKYWVVVKDVSNFVHKVGALGSPVLVSGDLAVNGPVDSGNGGAVWQLAARNFIRAIGGYPLYGRDTLSTGLEDGWVLESAETSAKGGTLDAKATTLRVGDDLLDRQYRSILSFDTSFLPDAAVVTAASTGVRKMGLGGTIDPFKTHGRLNADLRTPWFGTKGALEAGDFQAAASLAAAGYFGSTASAGWYRATFGSGVYSRVNRTGTTQLRLLFAKDDNDNRLSNYVILYSGDAPFAYRPYLRLEFYIP